ASCAALPARVLGPPHHGQFVSGGSSITTARPSDEPPSVCPPPSHLAIFSPVSLGASRSWLPEQVTSLVSARKRLKYFRTTTACARLSTIDASSRWSPARTTTSQLAAISRTHLDCGGEE